jgi:hypothetical protein
MFKVIVTNTTVLKPGVLSAGDYLAREKQTLMANQVREYNYAIKCGKHIETPEGFFFAEHVRVEKTHLGVDTWCYPLFNQREFKGDYDKDGKADSLQTCNVHSIAMAISGLTGKQIAPLSVYQWLLSKGYSKYDHSKLVLAASNFGVKSVFSTTYKTQDIINHLSKGLPVVHSAKYTHGGHIVLLAGYDTHTKRFLVLDPYGEFNIGGKYSPVSKPYWLSLNGFESVSYGIKGIHWAHLCSKI